LCSSQQKEESEIADIVHKVGIKSSPQNDVYKALTTVEGLSGWWTSKTQGESEIDGVLQLHFGGGGFDMKVLELHPTKHILWQVVDGPYAGNEETQHRFLLRDYLVFNL
jgi:uncharacterized protein YndB with AHSA1/START domain